MKALVLKDVYVLWKHFRIFVLLIAAMALVDNSFNNVFIVVWSAMLPYTAMSYDERSHWPQLAAMMPYSLRDIVLSKYVLGWLAMAASVVMSVVLQTAATLVGRAGCDPSTLLVSFLGGMIAIDIVMPMAFHFGVEKGRMVFFICLMGVAVMGGALGAVLEDTGMIPPAMLLMPLLAAAATVISIPLSIKFYRVD